MYDFGLINKLRALCLLCPYLNYEGEKIIMAELFVKTEDKFIRIDIKSIRYIEAFDNYVQIYASKKNYKVLTSLKCLEEKLPAHQFCRIHKSYMVSIPHIVSFDNIEVELGDITLPLGRNYKDHLKQHILLITRAVNQNEQD
jgi:DNA-binding LytR/AlgR family response regulator